ncbi:hypothetical protein [Nocardia sp. NPDC050406]|uniref:hypothetical protein n=1 Tax=Nocardia sp. NPDC050406 TaxID=3364318 RepID=UPI0037B14282
MIAKLTAGIALTAATAALTLAATGTAAAETYGSPGNAVVASATCTHSDDTIEITMDSPKIFAQAGYQPGEHQQVRYRTVVYDAAQNTIAAVTEYSSGKATATEAADVDDTKLKVVRSDPNGYRVIQQIEWLSPDQENPIAAVDLDATGYQIKDGRTLLGTFAVCK